MKIGPCLAFDPAIRVVHMLDADFNGDGTCPEVLLAIRVSTRPIVVPSSAFLGEGNLPGEVVHRLSVPLPSGCRSFCRATESSWNDIPDNWRAYESTGCEMVPVEQRLGVTTGGRSLVR